MAVLTEPDRNIHITKVLGGMDTPRLCSINLYNIFILPGQIAMLF